MEEEVLGEKSPLFGRRTSQLKVLPLQYFEAAQFYPEEEKETKAKYYATIGGTPYYLSLIQPDLSFEENIKRLYFDIQGYLYNEAELIMKQEFKEPINYNSILQAIASGATKPNEISQQMGIETNNIPKYLSILIELNFVEKRIPFGANPYQTKLSQYFIKEPFLRFWYRYVFRNRGQIEIGQEEMILKIALRDIDEYLGRGFKMLTKQFVMRQNGEGKLPFPVSDVQNWWGKIKNEPHEIDIMAEGILEKKLLLGECKWRNAIKISKILEKIRLRSDYFSKYEVQLALFTKKEIPPIEGVLTYSVEDYY